MKDFLDHFAAVIGAATLALLLFAVSRAITVEPISDAGAKHFVHGGGSLNTLSLGEAMSHTRESGRT